MGIDADKIAGTLKDMQQQMDELTEVDPSRMTLKQPITILAGRITGVAGVITPEMMQKMQPGQKPVQVQAEEVTITTGADLGTFIHRVISNELVFGVGAIPSLVVQLIPIIANVIGFNVAPPESTDA